MLLQVLRRQRHAAPCHIVRRRADRQGVIDQWPRDQVGLLEVAQPKSDVEPVFEQVRTAVGQHHIEFDLWPLQGKLTERRGHAFNAEGQRCGDAQDAARFVQSLFGEAFGIGQQAQHFEAALVVDAAELGQSLAAGGALQQLHTKPLLQRSQMIAYHRRRHIALQRGRRHAPRFDDFDVDVHRLKQIHYQAQLIND